MPQQQQQDSKVKALVRNVIAGGSAGVVEVVSTYPLDLVKTQMQLESGKGVRPTIAGTLRHQFQRYGFFGLYRGLASPIMAEAPKRAMKFTCNEIYKPMFGGYDYVLGAAAAGASAGMTEAFVNVPFETLKVRMQAKQGEKVLYKSTFDCFKKTLQQEGFTALYKGLEPQLWRNGVWNGIYFALILDMNRRFPKPKSKNQQLLNKFIAGSIGGALATTANTPFDVVKSRMQNQKGTENLKYRNTLQSLRLIHAEEGTQALYKGYVPRVLRLTFGGGIMVVAFSAIGDILKEYGL